MLLLHYFPYLGFDFIDIYFVNFIYLQITDNSFISLWVNDKGGAIYIENGSTGIYFASDKFINNTGLL
jgi:hypothetical protein